MKSNLILRVDNKRPDSAFQLVQLFWPGARMVSKNDIFIFLTITTRRGLHYHQTFFNWNNLRFNNR